MTSVQVSAVKVLLLKVWVFNAVYSMFKEKLRCTFQFSAFVFFPNTWPTTVPVTLYTQSTKGYCFYFFHYLISLIKKALRPTLWWKHRGVLIKKIHLKTVRYSVYSHDVFEGKVLLWCVIFVSFFPVWVEGEQGRIEVWISTLFHVTVCLHQWSCFYLFFK